MQKPREQAVDTELMVVLAGYGVLMAKGLTPGASTVSAADFLSCLKRSYVAGWDDAAETAPNPGAFDWAALGTDGGKYFRWAPSSGPHMCVARRGARLGPRCRAPRARLTRRRRAQAGAAGHGGKGAQGGAAAAARREGAAGAAGCAGRRC